MTKRTQIAAGWALQRADHGEMIHWSIINFAAIAGKIGKPGEGAGFSWHYGNGGMPASGKRMPIGLSQGRNPITKDVSCGYGFRHAEKPRQSIHT